MPEFGPHVTTANFEPEAKGEEWHFLSSLSKADWLVPQPHLPQCFVPLPSGEPWTILEAVQPQAPTWEHNPYQIPKHLTVTNLNCTDNTEIHSSFLASLEEDLVSALQFIG